MGYAGELPPLGAGQLRSRVIGACSLPDVPATREVSRKRSLRGHAAHGRAVGKPAVVVVSSGSGLRTLTGGVDHINDAERCGGRPLDVELEGRGSRLVDKIL